MKIRLIRYPYKDHEVGDILDLGEEKNKSMVSIGRAVFVGEGGKKKKAAPKVEAPKEPESEEVKEEVKEEAEKSEGEESEKPKQPEKFFASIKRGKK